MTVSTTNASQTYTGSGGTSFPITFTMLSNAHLIVKRREIATGIITVLALGVDYSLTGGDPATGVTTAVAVASTHQIILERQTPRTQSTNFDVGQTYRSAAVEGTVDRLTLIVQEIEEDIEQAVAGDPALENTGTQLIAAGGIITLNGIRRQAVFVSGNGGPVTCSLTQALSPGTSDLDEVIIIGTDNTNLVTIVDGGDVDLNGDVTLGLNDAITLLWIDAQSKWIEISRRA